MYQAPPPTQPTTAPTTSTWPMPTPASQNQFLYQPETLGNEFSVLRSIHISYSTYCTLSNVTHLWSFFFFYSDFLETLDEGSFFTSPLISQQPYTTTNPTTLMQPSQSTSTSSTLHAPTSTSTLQPSSSPSTSPAQQPTPLILPAATKTEQFLLTAADQASGSRDERLSRVIRSKYEAGLLKPYNYVKGYARLSRWMDSK